MQRPDVIALRQFYSAALGRKVKQRLRHILRETWPEHEGETILGLGYATPLLRALERTQGKHAAIIAGMPAAQGAIYWPIHTDNRSFLMNEQNLPLRDNSVNRVVMLHMLEHSNEPEKLLAECYRMLVPGGRIVIIVPNRRGLWQSLGETPYTQGTPYRSSQLKHLLHDE
ncbi:MAG: class I SAM-dependent methyltransferase, partial [Rickettsiales bacterium]